MRHTSTLFLSLECEGADELQNTLHLCAFRANKCFSPLGMLSMLLKFKATHLSG